MNVAIIPARGGSKRIPKKNIKDFCGKPIIAYSIMAAQHSGLFKKIIVSTDDEDIARISEEWGADVPFIRPKTLADDYTGINKVIKHAIQWFQKQDQHFDYICAMYATAPFIRVQDIVDSYEQLKASDKRYTLPITSFPSSIFRAIRLDGPQKASMFWPENLYTRTQDLEEAYHDIAQFHWGKSEAFLKELPIMNADYSLPIIFPRYLVHDIDTPEDWERAELVFEALMR